MASQKGPGKPKTQLDDLLGDLSESGSEDEDDSGGEADAGPGPSSKRTKKAELTVEDLERAGYSAPDVKLTRAPQEAVEVNYSWSDGRAAKEKETEETLEERRATQLVAQQGATETALYAQAALLRAEQLREERRQEKERLKQANKLSVSSKEKRKRDEGKASRGKSFVEEEKRMQRELGIQQGQGFD